MKILHWNTKWKLLHKCRTVKINQFFTIKCVNTINIQPLINVLTGSADKYPLRLHLDHSYVHITQGNLYLRPAYTLRLWNISRAETFIYKSMHFWNGYDSENPFLYQIPPKKKKTRFEKMTKIIFCAKK